MVLGSTHVWNTASTNPLKEIPSANIRRLSEMLNRVGKLVCLTQYLLNLSDHQTLFGVCIRSKDIPKDKPFFFKLKYV